MFMIVHGSCSHTDVICIFTYFCFSQETGIQLSFQNRKIVTCGMGFFQPNSLLTCHMRYFKYCCSTKLAVVFIQMLLFVFNLFIQFKCNLWVVFFKELRLFPTQQSMMIACFFTAGHLILLISASTISDSSNRGSTIITVSVYFWTFKPWSLGKLREGLEALR